MKVFAAFLFAFAVIPANATIYHCVDADGKKTLRDSPCDGSSAPKAPEPAAVPAATPKPRAALPKLKSNALPRSNVAQ
jgi:hypothetical protein